MAIQTPRQMSPTWQRRIEKRSCSQDKKAPAALQCKTGLPSLGGSLPAISSALVPQRGWQEWAQVGVCSVFTKVFGMREEEVSNAAESEGQKTQMEPVEQPGGAWARQGWGRVGPRK